MEEKRGGGGSQFTTNLYLLTRVFWRKQEIKKGGEHSDSQTFSSAWRWREERKSQREGGRVPRQLVPVFDCGARGGGKT